MESSKGSQRLEKENRRLRQGIVLLVAALGWPFLLGSEEKPGDEEKAVSEESPSPLPDAVDTLDVRRLVLRDANGKARAELGTKPDGTPVLSFLDPQGRATLTIMSGSGGPVFQMADGMGGAVWLSASPTGASLALSKGGGEAQLSTNGAGQPSARFQDPEGKVVWSAP